MEKEIETAFVVYVNTDGTFAINLEHPTEAPQVKRVATTYDVYVTIQSVIKELETSMLVDRIINALNPQPQTVPDSIKEKLKERGISPEEGEQPVN